MSINNLLQMLKGKQSSYQLNGSNNYLICKKQFLFRFLQTIVKYFIEYICIQEQQTDYIPSEILQEGRSAYWQLSRIVPILLVSRQCDSISFDLNSTFNLKIMIINLTNFRVQQINFYFIQKNISRLMRYTFFANSLIFHLRYRFKLQNNITTQSQHFDIEQQQFYRNIIFQKQSMLGFMSSSTEKKTYQHLIKTKLSSQQPIEIQYIKSFVSSHMKAGKQLDHFLKTVKKMILTPHTIFRILMLIHIYLQHGRQINEQTMINFMNFLLFHCTNFIQLKLQKQNINSVKNTIFVRTQMSTRQEEISQSKQILIYNTVKIYIRYLLKIISIYNQFKEISKVDNHQPHLIWMMINLIKSISSFTSNFILIGRYFIKEYGILVVQTIEMFNQDLIEFNQSLKKYIFHHNRVLSSSASSSTQEIEEFVKMLTEINILNQNLFQIYLGKYFYNQMGHIQQPQWININSDEFDTIFKISEANQKNQELNKLQKGFESQNKKNLVINKK